MRTTLLVCATMLMLILAGCSKSPEEASVDTMDEIIDVLDDVKTKDDAHKAKGKLAELFEELDSYGKKLNDKGAKALEYLNSDAGKALMMKSIELAAKIGELAPDVVEVLKEEFKKFRK